MKINYRFLLAVFAIIFLSAAATTIIFVKANGILDKKLAETAEVKRPANLDLVVIVDETCADCFNLNPVLDYITKENVKINSSQTVSSVSDAGKEMIKKFAIKKLPTFTLTGELNKDAVMSQFISKTGDIADNTFVFRQVTGAYVDVASGKVKGRLNLVLLTDMTCAECYDVTQHEAILQQFGMQPTTKVLDIRSADGAILKNKYGIRMVPTFVLSGDIKEYASFAPVWPQVGMMSNGAFIFTKGVPLMGTYKDLTTNKIITPPPATNQ